jgi:hypothetical protein
MKLVASAARLPMRWVGLAIVNRKLLRRKQPTVIGRGTAPRSSPDERGGKRRSTRHPISNSTDFGAGFAP